MKKCSVCSHSHHDIHNVHAQTHQVLGGSLPRRWKVLTWTCEHNDLWLSLQVIWLMNKFKFNDTNWKSKSSFTPMDHLAAQWHDPETWHCGTWRKLVSHGHGMSLFSELVHCKHGSMALVTFIQTLLETKLKTAPQSHDNHSHWHPINLLHCNLPSQTMKRKILVQRKKGKMQMTCKRNKILTCKQAIQVTK